MDRINNKRRRVSQCARPRAAFSFGWSKHRANTWQYCSEGPRVIYEKK